MIPPAAPYSNFRRYHTSTFVHRNPFDFEELEMRFVRAHLVLLLILCCLSSPLFAQSLTQAGNIRGTVTGSDGTPLPGVTVTVSGTSGRRTFVTTADGEYRFLGLDPGTYTITAELSGFATASRSADVLIGRNTDLPIQLAAAASEAITVMAASPVIDTRETATGQTVEEVELLNVPTARDPWVVLQSIPGVLVDRVNVGGNESGQQSYFVGKGVERHQTEWNVDGVAVSDMATTGTSTFYYDFDAFDEIQVSTGGTDPSVRTPGVHLNMVTKRGTNELKGSGRFFTTDDQWQSEATIPAEAVDYLTEGANSINHIDDYGLELGGPVMADKLWVWGAVSKNSINNFSTGGGAIAQKTKLDNINAKLNYQPTNNNTAELFYMFSNKKVHGRGLSPSRASFDVADDQTGPGDLLEVRRHARLLAVLLPHRQLRQDPERLHAHAGRPTRRRCVLALFRSRPRRRSMEGLCRQLAAHLSLFRPGRAADELPHRRLRVRQHRHAQSRAEIRLRLSRHAGAVDHGLAGQRKLRQLL